jgi:indolepyruvate ferredoxin oxidoreductase beta subunit
MSLLEKDPVNLIIAGVGGQGNVLISRLIGESLVASNYQVIIGETYGASQRGGSVASHVRISKDTAYSPIIPEGQTDVILGLEPVESLRILGLYGNQKTFVITNTRPIYPMSVAIGEADYPTLETIIQSVNELSQKAWYIDASQIAINLGALLLTNMVMVGVLVGTGLLPLEKDMFEHQLEASFKGERLNLTLKAFRIGIAEVKS